MNRLHEFGMLLAVIGAVLIIIGLGSIGFYVVIMAAFVLGLVLLHDLAAIFLGVWWGDHR